MALDVLAVTTDGGPCVALLKGLALPVRLPVVVSPTEAGSIAAARLTLPRPLTHDLILKVLQTMDAHLERVVVHGWQDGTFAARIEVNNGRRAAILECAVADALSLAVRYNLPVLVDGDVLGKADGVIWSVGPEDQEPGSSSAVADSALGDAASADPTLAETVTEASSCFEAGAIPEETPVPKEALEAFRPVIEKLDQIEHLGE